MYPEWFIGGPLHGEDKLIRFPNVMKPHIMEDKEVSRDRGN